MRIKALFAAASLTALTALTACATAPRPPAPTARESTGFTLATDQPLTPEQRAMRFDKADLAIRIIPADKAIDAFHRAHPLPY